MACSSAAEAGLLTFVNHDRRLTDVIKMADEVSKESLEPDGVTPIMLVI